MVRCNLRFIADAAGGCACAVTDWIVWLTADLDMEAIDAILDEPIPGLGPRPSKRCIGIALHCT